MPYTPVSGIKVFAWGRNVGAVAKHPQRNGYAFQYTPEWIESGIELAPLTMPLQRGSTVFDSLPEATFRSLPPLLADALPDDFGNAIVTASLARQGVSASAITALDRLAYQGARGMGALEFRPTRGPRAQKSTAIKLQELVLASRQALTGTFEGDDEAKAALLSILQVGTSAGGARAKAVVAFNPESREIRSGQLEAPPGFEHWLIKFDGLGHDRELGQSSSYGRIEFAFYLLATRAGITMTPCRLLEENGRAHFMTRRFDRVDGSKVHVSTLCAMSLMDYKKRGTNTYEQYMDTIDLLRLGDSAKEEGFRRMVFNVMASNCDDHTKNFSFMLPEGGRWQLTPAYDVTHAYNPKGEWTFQHLCSVNGKFQGITREDCLQLASRFGVPRAKAIIDEVKDALRTWKDAANEAGISEAEADRVSTDFRIL